MISSSSFLLVTHVAGLSGLRTATFLCAVASIGAGTVSQKAGASRATYRLRPARRLRARTGRPVACRRLTTFLETTRHRISDLNDVLRITPDFVRLLSAGALVYLFRDVPRVLVHGPLTLDLGRWIEFVGVQ